MRERGLHRSVMPCWRGTFAQPITSSPHDLSACKNTNNFITRLLFMIYFFTKKRIPTYFSVSNITSPVIVPQNLSQRHRESQKKFYQSLSLPKYYYITTLPHHSITPLLQQLVVLLTLGYLM